MKLTRIKGPAVLAAALSTVLMISIAYSWPTQDAYHPRNLDWNGCSKIAGRARSANVLFSYDQQIPTGSLLAIIGPYTRFSNMESTNIRSFLTENGGTVLLADDFGTGNDLLEALDAPARFSGEPLADLLSYSKDPRFPLITDFFPTTATANVSTMVLNRPAYIKIRNSSLLTELAFSSPFSFIDLDWDSRPEANTRIGSYPVMASIKVGRGLLVLVSDPSMFMNEMIDLYDNMQLFHNLLRIGGDTLFLDTAHLRKALLTDERVYFKDTIDSSRDLLMFPQSILLIVVVAALVLVFLLRSTNVHVRKSVCPEEMRRKDKQSLYSRPRL